MRKEGSYYYQIFVVFQNHNSLKLEPQIVSSWSPSITFVENGSLVEFIDSVFEQFFRASLTEDIAVQEHLLFYSRALTTTMAMVRMVTSVHQRSFAALRKPLPEFFFHFARCRRTWYQ